MDNAGSATKTIELAENQYRRLILNGDDSGPLDLDDRDNSMNKGYGTHRKYDSMSND